MVGGGGVFCSCVCGVGLACGVRVGMRASPWTRGQTVDFGAGLNLGYAAVAGAPRAEVARKLRAARSFAAIARSPRSAESKPPEDPP